MPTIKIEALLLHHIYYTSIFFCVLLPSLWPVMITFFWLFLYFCWSKELIQYPLIEAREIFPWLQCTLDQISHFLKLSHPLRPQLSHFTLDNIVFTNGYFFYYENQSFLLVEESDASPTIYITFSKPTGVKQIWNPPGDWLPWWV